MSARRVRSSRPVVVALALLVALGSLVVSGAVHAPPAQAAPQLPAGFTLTSTPSGQGEFEPCELTSDVLRRLTLGPCHGCHEVFNEGRQNPRG